MLNLSFVNASTPSPSSTPDRRVHNRSLSMSVSSLEDSHRTPRNTPVSISPIYSPSPSPLQVRSKCSNDTIIVIESHQGKHCINGWLGYIGRRESCFNERFNVSPSNLGVLKLAWESFQKDAEPRKPGYWHVRTNVPIGQKNETVITIQYQYEPDGGFYYIHGYPNNTDIYDAEINLRGL